MSKFVGSDELADSPEFLKALTGDDVMAASMARLTVTPLASSCMDWAEDELERGTDEAEMIHALAVTLVQVYASLVGSLMTPPVFSHCRKLFEMALDADFTVTANHTHGVVIEAERKKAAAP